MVPIAHTRFPSNLRDLTAYLLVGAGNIADDSPHCPSTTKINQELRSFASEKKTLVIWVPKWQTTDSDWKTGWALYGLVVKKHVPFGIEVLRRSNLCDILATFPSHAIK